MTTSSVSLDGQKARGRVERVEQAVIRRDVRAGDGVEERRLARVRIADDGHDGDLVFHTALALGAAHAAHLLKLGFELVDLAVDVAAVGLKLRLTGTLRSDGALAARAGLALKVRPHADQARQQILVLRQLHLQAALLRPRPLGEDVEDQAAAVEHLHARQLRQHAHLRGREVVVEDDHRGVLLLHHILHLGDLALADEAVRVGLFAALEDRPHHAAARGIDQRGQLGKALLVGAVLVQHGRAQAHQHRVVALFFQFLCLLQCFPFHWVPRVFFIFPVIIYIFPRVVNVNYKRRRAHRKAVCPVKKSHRVRGAAAPRKRSNPFFAAACRRLASGQTRRAAQ